MKLPMPLRQVAELEEQGASACPAHGMHLDPSVYGQLQSLRWVANPPPAVDESVTCYVAYGLPHLCSMLCNLQATSKGELCVLAHQALYHVRQSFISQSHCNCLKMPFCTVLMS